MRNLHPSRNPPIPIWRCASIPPAQVPDSKQPPPPESRKSFNDKILNPQSRLRARIRAQRTYLTTGIDLDKLKPP
jgi:hypothetical protein